MSDIDFEQFGEHLNGVVSAIETGDFEPVLRERVRPLVLQSIRDNFNSSAGADGSGWPARKRQGDGHPLLMESGALMQAATGGGAGHVTKIDAKELSVGVDKGAGGGGIPGAAVHQFGFPRKNIPPRPYLEARDEALDEAAEEIADAGLVLIGEVD